jgi:glycosyltransferase involved in cell wall biosynthesis
MRLLHTVSTLNFGGVERLATELALEQQRQGHQAAIYCYNHKTGELMQRLQGAGVPVYGPATPAIGGQRQAGLAHCAREWQPDLVHLHLNFSVLNQVRACARGRRPWPRFVVTQHTTIEARGAVFWRALVNYRLARPFIRGFTAVSRFAAQRAAQFYGVSPKKIAVIYNGVQPEAYQFDAAARAELRQRLQLPAGAILWGMVGRLVPIKGHANLIRAFAQARQADKRLALVLLGAGQELERLRALAAELGVAQQVLLPGESHNVRGWLSACDRYVHASRYETLSLAVLEALTNGLPVLATNVGGIAEIAAFSQEMCLVPGEQVQALGAALVEQSARPPLAALERARSKLPSVFLFDRMYQAYSAVYQRVTA